jgi:hypothetical protein
MAQGFALEDTASTAEVIGTMAGLYHGRKGKNAP